ncbi:MAG: malL, partial [Nitrospira sp.]|nr:malL [Nitrospira sp.]
PLGKWPVSAGSRFGDSESRTLWVCLVSRRIAMRDAITQEVSHWWQSGIIYQIYPRSFYDTNGDGIGDLPGILAKLDYLAWLGIHAIWISPVYPSPMADFGYDISNYIDIDPLFGTLKDFDQLVSSAHHREIKVIMDLVPNHTSDQHPWFVSSRASRHSPKRDWYIWKEPAPDGGPPNNWLSNFGGSAWTLDPGTGEYYYHAYLKEQPDLNWRNPDVQAAIHTVMRFWLDRGVDGFRVDVIWHLIKDAEYRHNPPNPEYRPGDWPYRQLLATYTTDRPEIHDIIGGMRAVMDHYDDRLMIGEIYLPLERLVTYYGTAESGCHLPFNFQLISLPWNGAVIGAAIEAYEAALPPHGWPNWVLGNHDKARIAARVGERQARVAAMLLLTLRGTPTIYYGDELGLAGGPISSEAAQDPWEKRQPGLGLGRDPSRTPMQWDNTPYAGFSTRQPWLPVTPDYQTLNVACAQANPQSVLTLYQRIIALRRAEPALHAGPYRQVCATNEMLSYTRQAGTRRFLVALNFSGTPVQVRCPELSPATVVLSTNVDREGDVCEGSIDLRADEGAIFVLDEKGV